MIKNNYSTAKIRKTQPLLKQNQLLQKVQKTIKPANKVSQVGGADKNSTSSLYSQTRNTKNLLMNQRLKKMQKY